MMKKILNWVAAPLAAAAFGLLLLAEARRPLRKATSNKLRRVATNLTVSAVTAVAIKLLFLPVTSAVSRSAGRRKLGLLNRVRLPGPARLIVGVVVLDYTFYWWHRMLHRVSLLWRFHRVHHADLDLDVSTAARFHFGEWVFSTAFRAVQIVVIGAGPMAESMFDALMMLATEFHHSNTRLPVDFEERLNVIVVTPRMHGIHHSIIEREHNSNFATIITAWDALHGTLRLDVPQEEITIGLREYRDESEVTLLKLLVMPFRGQRRADLPPVRPGVSLPPTAT